ncbi:MAG TPA: phosphatidate cytidylyltransferase [Flavobacteriia bacterium]|nr:phosphatidate cytidylyltransferase [Flavobacteriia bacterium]
MIAFLYKVLWGYFGLGGVVIYIINKNKTENFKNRNWLKYVVYLLIINSLFVSILIDSRYFAYLCFVIVGMGFYEIISNTLKTHKVKTGIFISIFLGVFAYFFLRFSQLPQNSLFYVLFMVTVFDAFSQLTGQLVGKKKLFQALSPNKTYAGLIGGYFMSILTSIWIRDVLKMDIETAIVIGFLMATAAFLGDLLASYGKRTFGIKDYSRLIPGHGGFLDRFDSLLLGGVFFLFIAKQL